MHEFKLSNNDAKTTANINKAWEESTTSERTVRRWFQKFCGEKESLKDEDCRGQLSILQNDDLRAIVEQNQWQSVRDMSAQLGVSISTVPDHLKQVRKVKKFKNGSRMSSMNINDLDKWQRYMAVQDLYFD